MWVLVILGASCKYKRLFGEQTYLNIDCILRETFSKVLYLNIFGIMAC